MASSASGEHKLWSDRHTRGGRIASSNGTAGRGEDDAPRDVASMKAEIAELQSETTASMDRAIAVAQATGTIATRTSTTLREQRHQMGEIDATAKGIGGTLKQTKYNLKYGLSWGGALTSPFRRSKPKAQTGGKEISPVFEDNAHELLGTVEAPCHDSSSNSSPKKKSALFKGRAKKAEAAQAPEAVAAPTVPRHAPDGFETQMDTLEGLLDGLNLQAKAIGAELKQQNEGIETLGDRVEPLRKEAASQGKQIKRRFGV